MVKRVALLFWGLTRGLKYTVESIENNIIAPLKSNGYVTHIYIHTYQFKGTYSNDRHNIKNFKLDFNEYQMLGPNFSMIEDQDEVKKKIDLNKYRSMPDNFKNNYQSNDFYILSLYSQLQVYKMFNEQRKNIKYDYCIYLRPDVLFLKPININWLDLAAQGVMVLPSWATMKKFHDYAENDRFCICSSENAHKYGALFDYLYPYSTLQPIVAEFFLGFVLNNFYKVPIERVKYLFKRVLPNGKIMHLDG